MSMQKLEEDFATAERCLSRKRDLLRDHHEELSAMMTALEVLGTKLIHVRLNATDIDISVCGDKAAFREVWGILRKMGYNTEAKPEVNDPSFSTWFHPEGDNQVKFWLSFSSTVCKRVKVGTETVERDLYEVQCEDS